MIGINLVYQIIQLDNRNFFWKTSNLQNHIPLSFHPASLQIFEKVANNFAGGTKNCHPTQLFHPTYLFDRLEKVNDKFFSEVKLRKKYEL